MKATNIAAQLANEVSVDARDAELATDKEIRLLQDLEMVLVGGGEGMPSWG